VKKYLGNEHSMSMEIGTCRYCKQLIIKESLWWIHNKTTDESLLRKIRQCTVRHPSGPMPIPDGVLFSEQELPHV
jgi:hypothetical protein